MLLAASRLGGLLPLTYTTAILLFGPKVIFTLLIYDTVYWHYYDCLCDFCWTSVVLIEFALTRTGVFWLVAKP